MQVKMENLIGYFFPGECYEKVVSDYNFFDGDRFSFDDVYMYVFTFPFQLIASNLLSPDG